MQPRWWKLRRKQLSDAIDASKLSEAQELVSFQKKRAAEKQAAIVKADELFSKLKLTIEQNPASRFIQQTYCERTTNWSCDFSVTEADVFLGEALVALAQNDGYNAKLQVSSGCRTVDNDYPDECHVRHYVEISW